VKSLVLVLSLSLAFVACQRNDVQEAPLVNKDWKLTANGCDTATSYNPPQVNRTLRFRGFQFKDSWSLNGNSACNFEYRGRYSVSGNELTMTYQEVVGGNNCEFKTGINLNEAYKFQFERQGNRLVLRKPVTGESTSGCNKATLDVFE
jgi:hypothetical protein